MMQDEDFFVGRRAPGLELHRSSIDMPRMRKYRLERVQAELQRAGCGAVVLMDPINRRYATGASLHTLFQFHLPSRYAVVPAAGKAILFQAGSAADVPETADVVGEVRPAIAFTYYYASHRVEERARKWAAEIAEIARQAGGTRVAVDRLEPVGLHALEQAGLTVVNAQEMLEQARLIKSADEIGCMLASISVAETGIAELRAALKPGVTENDLLAIIHQANIRGGGEWIEGKLLASGGNTNPWGHEACGKALLKPGLSFREYAEKAWEIPEKYRKNRYGVIAHGVGMCDEYPGIGHLQDWAERGLEDHFEQNMTVCVESYIGLEGGADGVKIEEQMLVTASGYQRLSTFPYE